MNQTVLAADTVAVLSTAAWYMRVYRLARPLRGHPAEPMVVEAA